MDKINSYCVICGTGYYCCISCPEQRDTSWRILTDTANHFKIYMIICDYRDKKISKEIAKEQLSKVDITGWENFKDGVNNLIAEILEEENTTKDNIKKKKQKKDDLNSDDNIYKKG